MCVGMDIKSHCTCNTAARVTSVALKSVQFENQIEKAFCKCLYMYMRLLISFFHGESQQFVGTTQNTQKNECLLAKCGLENM